jgi:Xaa-Pro aminopeptidase
LKLAAASVLPAGGSPGNLTEFDMVQWLSDAMRREGLVWENGPNVSANANSSDSHYEPTAERSAPIREGDFLLIDIWGRLKTKPGSVFYDITWTGVVGREPTEREQLVFETVRDARDAAIAVVEQAFARAAPSAASRPTTPRAPSSAAGFGEYFTHRTGHNIARIHGPARTSTTWKPTTSAASCPTPASPSSPESICPSSASAAKSTCSPPYESVGHRQNPAGTGSHQNLALLLSRSALRGPERADP